jgi:HAMP domain-containing protein
MAERNPFRPSLRTLLTSSVIAAAVLPLLCAGILMVLTVTRAMQREIGERNLLITRGLAGEVNRFLQEPLSLLEQVRRMLETQTLQDQSQIDAYLASVLSSYGYFDRVERLDAEGAVRLVAPADHEALGDSRAGQHFFKMAPLSSAPLWSPAFLSVQTGLPTLTLALPLRSGMIVGYLNLSVLGEMVARVKLPGSGWSAILDVEGTILAHRNPEMVTQRVSLGHEPFFREARQGREGTRRQPFSSQVALISAVRVPLTGWVVALSQPESEALAPARVMIRIIVAGTALAMGMALAIALFGLHRTLRPLSQLASLTHRIADGDYRLQPPQASYRELEDLSQSFQRMVTAVEQREIERSRSE